MTAVNSQRPLLMLVDYRVGHPDHEWVVAGRQTDPISVRRNSHYACLFWEQGSRWLLSSNIYCSEIRKGLVVDSTQSQFGFRNVTESEGV
jgi:hypothetical protein